MLNLSDRVDGPLPREERIISSVAFVIGVFIPLIWTLAGTPSIGGLLAFMTIALIVQAAYPLWQKGWQHLGVDLGARLFRVRLFRESFDQRIDTVLRLGMANHKQRYASIHFGTDPTMLNSFLSHLGQDFFVKTPSGARRIERAQICLDKAAMMSCNTENLEIAVLGRQIFEFTLQKLTPEEKLTTLAAGAFAGGPGRQGGIGYDDKRHPGNYSPWPADLIETTQESISQDIDHMPPEQRDALFEHIRTKLHNIIQYWHLPRQEGHNVLLFDQEEIVHAELKQAGENLISIPMVIAALFEAGKKIANGNEEQLQRLYKTDDAEDSYVIRAQDPTAPRPHEHVLAGQLTQIGMAPQYISPELRPDPRQQGDVYQVNLFRARQITIPPIHNPLAWQNNPHRRNCTQRRHTTPTPHPY